MDRNHLDAIVRRLATASPRRALLGLVLVLGTGLLVTDAEAKIKRKKKRALSNAAWLASVAADSPTATTYAALSAATLYWAVRPGRAPGRNLERRAPTGDRTR